MSKRLIFPGPSYRAEICISTVGTTVPLFFDPRPGVDQISKPEGTFLYFFFKTWKYKQ